MDNSTFIYRLFTRALDTCECQDEFPVSHVHTNEVLPVETTEYQNNLGKYTSRKNCWSLKSKQKKTATAKEALEDEKNARKEAIQLGSTNARQ